MKAVVYYKYGPPEVLSIEDVVSPVPRDHEILIKVHAAEVTKADCELRSFNFPVQWFKWPLRIAMGITKPKRPILGGYFSGEVADTGKSVTGFKAGDQVFGCARLRMGAYAEYMCLPQDYTIVPKPTNMNFEQAAAVPLGGLNAWHFLRKAKVQPGEKVLINGAGGSIGTFGLQIAKNQGAEVTVVDSGIKESMLRDMGADHFINYETQDFTQGSQKFDVILDMVASSSYSGCVNLLNPKGRYLMANPRLSDMFRSLVTNKSTDKKVIFEFAPEKKEELLELKRMTEAGRLRSVVDTIYPMDQVVEAHRRVENEQRLGTVVLKISKSNSAEHTVLQQEQEG